MINLGQNPRVRPIASRMLPALLKKAFVWKLAKCPDDRPLERPMLGKEFQ